MDPSKLSSQTPLPSPVKVMRGLFLLDAILWIALGVESLVRLSDTINVPIIVAITMAVLMFIYAGILIWLRWGLNHKPRLSFYLSILLFAFTAVLSVADQIGFWDLVSVVLNAFMVVFLFINRRFFLNVETFPSSR